MSEFLQRLERIAGGDAHLRLPISPEHDELDAIAHCINVLVGELAWATRDALEAQELAGKQRTDALTRENEERFRLVMNNVASGLYTLNLEGLVTYMNPAAERMFGWRLEEIKGRKLHDHCPELRVIETGIELRNHQDTFIRKDGSSFPVVFSASPLTRDRATIGIVVGFSDDTERRTADTAQKMAQAALSSLSRRLMEAQEQERAWIARELHDDVGQRTAALNMQMHCLAENLAETSLRDWVKDVHAQTEELGVCVRAITRRLHPSILEFAGLSAAASRLCEELSVQYDVRIAFDAEDVPADLPKDAALALFRVLQEGLNNAIKYSGVREFTVRLVGSPTDVRVEVIDKGVGFDVECARKHGLGLISMDERLRLVNGRIFIESQTDRGTALRAQIPLRSGQ
jgi:PAS domain S-box-containing protein